MSLGIDPEEAAALAVLDSLGRLDSPEDTSVPEPEDEIDQVLRKLYGDAIAMLAYSLEPVAPPAGLRGAILGVTVGETTQEVEPVGAPAPPPLSSAPPRTERPRPVAAAPAPGLFAPVAPERPFAGEAPPAFGRAERSGVTAIPGRRPAPRAGWVALAAALVLGLIGAGFWIAYLQSELAAQSARLAWAEREWKSEVTAARDELRSIEQRLSLVTSPAVTVFHLRCPSGGGPGATANANVYVSSDRKKWDLQVQGLAAQPEGREYQLWFLVGDETRNGGCFSVQDGEVVLLNPASFPPGTTGIAISVEPKGGSARPTTAPILVSDEPVRL